VALCYARLDYYDVSQVADGPPVLTWLTRLTGFDRTSAVCFGQHELLRIRQADKYCLMRG
jgi:hypothetical protein